jgi:hypothetical protein
MAYLLQTFEGNAGGEKMFVIRTVTLGVGAVATLFIASRGLAQSPTDDPPPPPYSVALTQDVNSTQTQTQTQTTSEVGDIKVQPSPPPPAVVPITITDERPVNVIVAPQRREIGLAVSLGGGVGQFTDSALRDHTGVNGEYEARVLFGTRSPIAVEAAYVGTAGSIDALGLDDNAVLISNGVEGLARLNLGNRLVQPFIVGGASWVRYSIVNASVNTSDVRDRDDVFAVPVGAGIATYVGDSGFMADVRFMYRFAFGNDLMKSTAPGADDPSLANWNVSLRLGYAF